MGYPCLMPSQTSISNGVRQDTDLRHNLSTSREAAICGKPHIEPCDGIARRAYIPHTAMVWGLHTDIKPGHEEGQ